MSVKYSQGILTHIICNDCKKWWTIADWEVASATQITCPHCGRIHTIFEKAEPLTKGEGGEQKNPSPYVTTYIASLVSCPFTLPIETKEE
jgi:ribosomal protein S27E